MGNTQGGGGSAPPKKASTRVFGVPLSELWVRNRFRAPTLYTQAIDQLKARGIQTEGLFRVSVAGPQLQQLKRDIDRGKPYNLEELDVHIVASILRDFLTSLPEAVLNNYDVFVNIADKEQEEVQIFTLHAYVSTLPRHHRALLIPLVDLAKQLISEPRNKTTKEDVLSIMAGLLLRSDDKDAETELRDMPNIKAVLDLLLQHSASLFTSDPMENVERWNHDVRVERKELETTTAELERSRNAFYEWVQVVSSKIHLPWKYRIRRQVFEAWKQVIDNAKGRCDMKVQMELIKLRLQQEAQEKEALKEEIAELKRHLALQMFQNDLSNIKLQERPTPYIPDTSSQQALIQDVKNISALQSIDRLHSVTSDALSPTSTRLMNASNALLYSSQEYNNSPSSRTRGNLGFSGSSLSFSGALPLNRKFSNSPVGSSRHLTSTGMGSSSPKYY
eukprot:GILK01006715.1.p1 GENE.GILK01006715.1~~GILK01006715.1.p1  ORF type:complete len:447 (+),score=77.53 GILK01006715.1:49-1389(+)